MESNTFKSVAFGGFDKQDVIRYIENEAKEHTQTVRVLQEENASLLAQNEELFTRNSELTAQLETLQAENKERSEVLEQLRQETDALTAEVAALRTAAQNVQELTAEVAVLRPEAEAYRQFRNRIGDIECEAQKRAVELETNTYAVLQKALSDFRSQYQQLSSTFAVTTNHVNNELRKIEVNLSQLPCALNQIGVDLSNLESSLQKPEE